MSELSPAADVRSAIRAPRANGAARRSDSSLVLLQRHAGNRAVVGLLEQHRHLAQVADTAVQREDASASVRGAAADSSGTAGAALTRLIAGMGVVSDKAAHVAQDPEADPDGYLPRLRRGIDQVRDAQIADPATQQAVLAAFARPRLQAAEQQVLADDLARSRAETSEPTIAEPSEPDLADSPGSTTLQTLVKTVELHGLAQPGPVGVQELRPMVVQRQLSEALVLWGTGLLTLDAELSPVEAATGPPGWAVAAGLALAGATLLGAGVLVARSRARARADPVAVPTAVPRTQAQPLHMGNIHVQGDDISAPEPNFPWSRDVPMTKAEAMVGLAGLRGVLTSRQLSFRNIAFNRAAAYIANTLYSAPPPKFKALKDPNIIDDNRFGTRRVDIEIIRGQAFV